VRHEAAEALGAIGTARAIEVLREHAGDEEEIAGDEEEIVRESCWVALMWLE
jgi:HEAT repeat protein